MDFVLQLAPPHLASSAPYCLLLQARGRGEKLADELCNMN